MSKNQNLDQELDEREEYRVTVELDDGDEIRCAILTIFDVDGQDYIALIPVDENDQPVEEGDAYLYRYFEDEDGNPGIDNIETEDEFERVSDRFDEYLDEQEFDAMD